MEESEERRERLKAMRMEAAQTEVSDSVNTSAMAAHLSNPLVEGCLPVQEDSCVTPRFDFYTDPMAAFSNNKRRSKVGNQIQQDYLTPPSCIGTSMAGIPSSLSGPRNREMTPSPNPPFQPNLSAAQGMNQAHGLYNISGPYGSPVGMASPYPAHRGTPGVWNGFDSTPRYGVQTNSPRSAYFLNPGFRPVGSPEFRSGRGRGPWLGQSPSPISVRGGSPSPSPKSGRGRSGCSGNSMSTSSGWSSGRGRGPHSHVSAQDRPELFFSKSMVEDPWKSLKPVIWNRQHVFGNKRNTPDSSKTWLPKSIRMKKQRVSETTNISSSQQSLAEYLAASFNEAVDDTSGVQ